MSNINTGSISGVAGTSGNMEIGQGAREVNRWLTRNDSYEASKPQVNWVLRPIEIFSGAATPKPWEAISEKLRENWFDAPLQPSDHWC